MYFTEIESIDTTSVNLKKCNPFKSLAPLDADHMPRKSQSFFVPKLHKDLIETLLTLVKIR